MKSYSVSEIKKALNELDTADLVNVCLRVAKYKKENKELLSYLMFDCKDESQFIEDIKSELDDLFEHLKDDNNYRLLKQLRKISRTISKPIKYSGIPTSQAEVLIYFTKKLKDITKSKMHLLAYQNFYLQQIKKIETILNKMHEDYRYDFEKDFERLRN